MATLVIKVELTVDSPSTLLECQADAQRIKELVESNISSGTLPSTLWQLGTYRDAEVVNVSLNKTYDTRQS